MFLFRCFSCRTDCERYKNKETFKKRFFEHFNQNHGVKCGVYGKCKYCTRYYPDKFINAGRLGDLLPPSMQEEPYYKKEEDMLLKIIEYDFTTCYMCIKEQENGMDIKEPAI